MSRNIIIALDAMGGDHAPAMVIDGAAIARRKYPHLSFQFYGDETKIKPMIARHHELRDTEIFHAPTSVPADMKPSTALRQGKHSSMRLAINAVAESRAHGVVSAGNTGALMVMARMVLGMLPGIERPAITTTIPTMRSRCVMLDLGANLECDPENLVQFAIMGGLFARAIGIPEPNIALLNIGMEEMKGHDEIRAAAAILKETPVPGRFIGYMEADDIPTGRADVVVTDGFTGNIALKTAEGTAKLCASFLKQAMQSSFMAKMGALLASNAFKLMKQQMDPRAYNGAMLLGLQGICVKSHGGVDARGFANAIHVASQLIERGLNDTIKDEFARLYGMQAAPLIDQPAQDDAS
jgi:glycerol-3-phosphate acyltransferase PlsX